MARPVERPTPMQLDQMRKASHKAIDRVLDAWPKMLARMRDYESGGMPARSPGLGASVGRSAHGDPTGEKATQTVPEPDACADLVAWLEAERELLGLIFAVADGIDRLG